MARTLDPRDWLRVHAGTPEHPKVEPLSDSAFRTLFEAWCLCRRTGNDGRIPRAVWEKRWKPKARKELVAGGLVHLENDAAVMHDWLEHQPSAAELDAVRSARAEAGRKGGQSSGRTRSKRSSKNEANASPGGGNETVTSGRKSDVSDTPTGHRDTDPNSNVSDTVENGSPAQTAPEGEANASDLLDQTLKQNTKPNEAEIEIEKELSTYVPSGSYVSNAETDEKTPPRGPAVDPTGWRLVRAEISDEHPQAVRTDLALRAARLLKAGTSENDVRAALALWLTKPNLGPGVLPSLVSEVVKTRAAPPSTPTEGAATAKTRGWLELGEELEAAEQTAALDRNPNEQRAIRR